MLCCILIIIGLSLLSTAITLANVNESFQLPIYYITVPGEKDRDRLMVNHLKKLKVPYFRKISALLNDQCIRIFVSTPCRWTTKKDISVICSHLYTLYYALHDTSNSLASNSNFFVVLEDDVQFLYRINFLKLIEEATKSIQHEKYNFFGALQLTMSGEWHIQEHFNIYNSTGKLFTYRPRGSRVWSAQAVLYNKTAIRPFIDAAVVKFDNGSFGFKMISTRDYQNVSSFAINKDYPAIACECLVADKYLYSAAQPAYISNIPLLNSAMTGLRSNSHQKHVRKHLNGFALVEEIYEYLNTSSNKPLPSFIVKSIQPMFRQRNSTKSWHFMSRQYKNRVFVV